MKTTPSQLILTPVIAALSLLLSATSHAQVIGINSAAASYATIQFDDTTSLDPSSNPGTTNTSLTVTPWSGAIHSHPFTLDLVTLDTAQGDITGTLGTAAPNDYDIFFSNVLLTQAPLNTQFAHLIFSFSIEYQIGPGGLASQPTLFPNFNVSGTVQPGGFANVGGFINYAGTNTAGTISTVETVTYGTTFNTPGSFLGVAPGTPFNGTTPTLIANSTLTISGTINFMVDPAEIYAQSEMVPEPSSALLMLLSLPLLLRRRRA